MARETTQKEKKEKCEKSGYEEAKRDVGEKMSMIPGLWLNCCCRGTVLSENNYRLGVICL